jgi:hypothetical protein
MNVTLLHEHLVEEGFDVLSVDEKGHVTLAGGSSEKDIYRLFDVLAAYKEPTRAEREAKILARRDDLLNQLLFERFLPSGGVGSNELR